MASSKMGVFALLLVVFAAATNAAHIDSYRAYLKGKNEVPEPVRSKAWGWSFFQVDNEMMMINITFAVTGIEDMIGAHLHNGTRDMNGPVVLPLYSPAEGLPLGTASSLTVEGEAVTMFSMPISAAPWMPELLMSGRAYVNVHTMMYPGGELRGQVNYLMPPAMQTIADVVGMYPELSTLLAAVSADPALLAAATDASTAVTLLAPTNAAFEAALAALGISAGDLIGNAELLNTVLSYHIIPAVIPAAGVPATPGADVGTLQGSTVKAEMTMDGMVMFNDMATVTTADIMVNGGTSIIHIIDAVLLPPMK